MIFKGKRHVLPVLLVLVTACAGAACGKRGAPLAPIRVVPAAASNVAARRVGDHVELRFNIPSENTDRSAPPVLSRVEIYAAPGPPSVTALVPMSIAAVPLPIPIVVNNLAYVVPSTPLPLTRFAPVQLSEPPGFVKAARGKKKPADTVPPQIMTKKHLRGKIEVAPAPPPEGEAAPASEAPPPAPKPESPATPAAEDTRPKPGWTVTFDEDVAAERKVAATDPDVSMLRYVIVGIAGAKRLGAPSAVLEVPLTNETLPPKDLAVTYDETTLKLAWTPGATAQSFRVYRTSREGKEDGPPLNPAALTTPAFSAALLNGPPPDPAPVPAPIEFGKETCFVVRSVLTRGSATVESDAAGPACVTPVDTFPPPAPSGLSALPTESQVQLLWTPVSAADLAGYLVLRGEEGAKPEPLMTQPITEATYTDAKVKTGVHYTYVVVAVDKAGNRSNPSNQVEEIR